MYATSRERDAFNSTDKLIGPCIFISIAIYSDYDVRDRGHGDRGGRGHSSQSSRDAYRERRDQDPERNLSDQSRDTQQSSGSFNRSMSNTDITPDDKVGKYSSINRAKLLQGK